MRFTVPFDHPCLPGHFPGRPLVPGVVVLERVLDAIEAQHGALGPVRLPQVKFLQPLLPGETACVELNRADAADGSPRWRFRVLRDTVLLASGEVVVAATAVGFACADTEAEGADARQARSDTGATAA